MADTPSQNVVVGTPVTLSYTFRVGGIPTAATGSVSAIVVDPSGAETTYTSEIANPDTGVYVVSVITTMSGLWHWRWVINGQATDEGLFTAESDFGQVLGEPDLTDLLVWVPRARRVCEGPYGAPETKPPLLDSQLYEMVADACADVILQSGSLFGHQLVVKTRDPLVGFATAWKTDAVLTEWEGAVLATQTALNFFLFLVRDMKTSLAVKNEGTEYTYTLSANVLAAYIKELQTRRDLALEGLRKHHPVLDRYASNIRVRDQATVALLEWWSTNQFDAQGGGLPGGQEAAVVPWTPGWYGGFTLGGGL